MDNLTRSILNDLAKTGKITRVGFAWDPRSARYRNLRTGRYVSESTVRSLGERFMNRSSQVNIDHHTGRLIDGKLDLPRWQLRIAREVKDAHIVNAALGRGGRAQMTQADWGRVGARLREQYKYLNRFAEDIKAGRLTEGEIRRRAAMYARSARTSYWDALTAAKIAAGFDQERRILHPAEHCTECVEQAGLGWSPIGTLLPIGFAKCLTNCQCTKEFRKSMEIVP